MKLPDGVNQNSYLAYKEPKDLEPERKIKAEAFVWDQNHPKSLVNLCIEKLTENWLGKWT